MVLLNDFDTSVKKALEEINPHYMDLEGIVVCGTHKPHNTEDMINMIKIAREKKIPFLGICFGHQLAFIEYCRNVLNIKDATSEEFGKGTFVVTRLPDLNVGFHHGETWWNRFHIDPELEGKWRKPDWFVTCQYHPEYQSSFDKPHPLLVKFLKLCQNQSSK